jgi:hypothetical protein
MVGGAHEVAMPCVSSGRKACPEQGNLLLGQERINIHATHSHAESKAETALWHEKRATSCR